MPNSALLRLLVLCWVAAACGPADEPFEVYFAAADRDMPIDCDGGLADLRFYVNELAVLRPDGSRAPVVLADNARWQGQGIGLVDLEDGAAACANGTPDRNDRIVGRVAPGEVAGLAFTVGVPFAPNHADPLSATAPLDDMSMHWHWRSGYKFLRAAIVRDGRRASVHVGSAGCRGAVTAIEGCDFPNRVDVRLGDWRPGMPVTVDLRPLIEALPPDAESVTHCESGPADPACALLMPVFGFDVTTGMQTAPQRVFRTGR